jgi:hypothetical protein
MSRYSNRLSQYVKRNLTLIGLEFVVDGEQTRILTGLTCSLVGIDRLW